MKTLLDLRKKYNTDYKFSLIVDCLAKAILDGYLEEEDVATLGLLAVEICRFNKGYREDRRSLYPLHEP